GLLDGRTALVTGGSRGLGRALCRALAAEGANIAFTYSRSEEDAAAPARELSALGRRVWPFRVSVLDKPGVANMVRAVEAEAGRIDVLVNNAGVGQVVPLALMEEE